jgi:hypothetical protein
MFTSISQKKLEMKKDMERVIIELNDLPVEMLMIILKN